jgi:hypothetical protein
MVGQARVNTSGGVVKNRSAPRTPAGNRVVLPAPVLCVMRSPVFDHAGAVPDQAPDIHSSQVRLRLS